MNDSNTTTTDKQTKVYIPYKRFFKLLKKAIKTAKNKEELNKYYDKAIEHQKYFAPGEGRLIEEMYFNKMNKL